jgi:hypothetical protein
MKSAKPKPLFRHLVAGLMTAVGATGAAHAVESYPTLLGAQGCGPMAGDTILMNQMIKAGSANVLMRHETPGYIANIRDMENPSRWKNTVVATQDTIVQPAFRGCVPEIQGFLPTPVKICFKLLCGEAWWAQGKFFVTYNPEIKTVEDLRGRKIALGLRSQSDWGFSRARLRPHAGERRHQPRLSLARLRWAAS